MPLRPLLLAALIGLAPALHAAPIAEVTKGLTEVSGFMDVYRDPDKGRVLLGVKALDAPFILFSSLPWGLGSNDVGLDRGQLGRTRLVEFRRAGPKLLLVERNTRFVAETPDALERLSVQQAFAESVLWSGELLAVREGADPEWLVDFTSFMVGDRHGVARRLDDAKQGKYSLDAGRSAPVIGDAKSFPDNTELEAILTFAGSGPAPEAPQFVNDVAMDAESLTVRQHLSLVRLPPPGFRPRAYHPYSGGIDSGVIDFGTPLAASIDQRFQWRHRLEKVDPTAARSRVKEPIVFYLDPGTPEPVRSALLDGARWWAKAFEAAGFIDAYRVELMPPGMDPMDVRYNTIQWVHRATRGWSYGASIVDPRTGELIKSTVTLGSQRVRQDLLIAEALTAPYEPRLKDDGRADAARQAALDLALARLRQLSAHEVGHTLGLAHNFAASWKGNGSVMDYPHPVLELKDGQVDVTDAYGVGVGPWDEYAIKHAYLEVAPAQEAAALAALRAEARRAGLAYVGDPDARSGASAHPDGQLWDFGADAFSTFDQLLAVRRVALANFGRGVLPAERQSGELEARLVPVYLLHRYQVDAVARKLGGARYEYGLIGDTQPGTTPVAADEQRAALTRLLRALSAEELALPADVLDVLTPPAHGYERNREYFGTKTAPLFDPYAAVGAGAALTAQYLFLPQRLNRLAWQQARDAQQPGIADVLGAVFAGTWQRATPTGLAGGAAVQATINWTVLDCLVATLDGGGLQPTVAAAVRGELSLWQRWLARNARGDADRTAAADWLAKYLADPGHAGRRPVPSIPPGAPI
jgi:hypothetical protein